MEWPLHKLEDLTEPARPITYGVVKPGPEDPKHGVRFIRGGDIFEGKLAIESLRTITAEVSKSYARTLLFGGELVVSLVGNPGHVAVVPKALAGANLARQAGLVALRKEVDADFIKYFLMSPQGRAALFAQMTGSVQVVINLHNLRTVRVPLPPLPIQRRIAGILSAYDDLIENSQRRIKILEAMARALYREWFVHFRFPGHETVPRVPSPLGEIPQGWEVRPVANSFDISGGGTPSRKDERYWEGGTIQWFSPSDLTGAGTMFMDDSSDHITQLGLADSSARLFPARSVMLTSRATIGAIAINTHEASTNQGFITCLPNECVPLFFLFHWVKENVSTFQRMASGATFKEISRGVFKTIEFLQPPVRLTEQFETMAVPVAEQVLALQRQIQTLRRTRDLLLPRLLSGQIDVEAIAP